MRYFPQRIVWLPHKDDSEPLSPRAPHWFEFSQINDLPNDWSFEVLEWNDDPDADGVDDRGEAEVIRGDHRFVVITWLQPRSRTHDRYWSDDDTAVLGIFSTEKSEDPRLRHAGDVPVLESVYRTTETSEAACVFRRDGYATIH